MKNLIFLTMASIQDVNNRGIYTDLLRKFRKEGWNVCVVYPKERRTGDFSKLVERDRVHYLGVKTLNLQKTSTIEKGIGQLLVEGQYKRAIKRYLPEVKYDLILYSTPPITFSKVIVYLKKRNPMAKSYLLLKDIFPQNAVDIGLMPKTGIIGFLYNFFRKKEKQLYSLSDFIGCMSPANVRYLIEHNPEVSADKVEIAPNSYENSEKPLLLEEERWVIRDKFNLPFSCPIFIYGGNLGKPQGIPFMIDCLEENANRADCHFIVVGDGTEYPKIEAWFKLRRPKNVSVFQSLPKADYDRLVSACDIGLIFLDYRFTIPNYPSRLLPYLMEKKPIIAVTDPNSDIGRIAEENGFGFWCPSNNVTFFTTIVNKILHSDLVKMGENGYRFYSKNYTVENTYNAIAKHF